MTVTGLGGRSVTGRPSLALPVTIAGAAVALLASPTFPLAVAAPLAVIAASVAVLAGHAARERDPLGVASLLAVIVAVLYLARPAWIATTGRWGPAARHWDRVLHPELAGAFTQALWIAAAGCAALAAGYAVAGTRARHVPSRAALVRAGSAIPVGPVVVAFCVAAPLALVAVHLMVGGVGNLGAYLADSGIRKAASAGQVYLTVFRMPLKGVLFAAYALGGIRPGARRALRPVVAVSLAISAAGDLVAGGRAGLLIGTLLPLVLVHHHLRRRIPVTKAVLLAVAAAVLLVGVRVVLRDAVYDNPENLSVGELVVDNVADYPAETIGSREAVPFDALLTLTADPTAADLPLRGTTYLDALAAPVPRQLWPDKPAGGGSTWFTATYFPGFYDHGVVETSLSLYGEAWANFGLVGVVVVAFVAGAGLRAFAQWSGGGGPARRVVAAAFCGYLVLCLRGDAFQFVANNIGAAVAALTAAALLRGARQVLR